MEFGLYLAVRPADSGFDKVAESLLKAISIHTKVERHTARSYKSAERFSGNLLLSPSKLSYVIFLLRYAPKGQDATKEGRKYSPRLPSGGRNSQKSLPRKKTRIFMNIVPFSARREDFL